MTSCNRPTCGKTFAVFAGETPVWKPVLVQRSCRDETRSFVHFDLPTKNELVGQKDVLTLPAAITKDIPEGVETSILRRAGFQRWCDLYPGRQLTTLFAAANAVESLEISEALQARLRLAICGAAEMAGFASRWDRYYPKAFEAVANHRFAALGFACETNLLAERGRGTIRRRFASSVAAARWMREEVKTRSSTRVRDASGRRTRLTAGALLAYGSSERQLVSDHAVDLVLTDPPYFDDIQYSELASLFLAWARSLKLVPTSVSLDLRAEAVVNATRGTGVAEYRALLTRIFRETRRTLKVDGRLVITFHNTDIRAWWALARALDSSGFAVVALAVAQSENTNDHSKRNRRSFTKDVVLECRAKSASGLAKIVGRRSDSQERELCAAGQAVAVGGSLDLRSFEELFLAERGNIRSSHIHVAERALRTKRGV